VIAAVVSVVIGVLLQPPLTSWLRGKPSLTQQIDDIEHDAAAHDRYVQVHVAFLRGPGQKSLFVDSIDTGSLLNNRNPTPDRITIWDLVGSGSDAHFVRSWAFSPHSAYEAPLPWRFHLQSVGDLSEDGEEDVIGILQPDSAAHPAKVPVMIRWDPGQQRYRILPLITQAPSLARPPRGDWAGPYQDLDKVRVSIWDSSSGIRFSGYSAQYFAVARGDGAADVVVAYPFQGNGLFPAARYELLSSFLNFEHLTAPEGPPSGSCSGLGPAIGRISFGELVEPNSLISAWHRISGC
jgi:hypothetical protein